MYVLRIPFIIENLHNKFFFLGFKSNIEDFMTGQSHAYYLLILPTIFQFEQLY